MDRNICDMCGLYLHLDRAACEQCQKHAGVVKRIVKRVQIGGYDGRENEDREIRGYVSVE